MVHLEVVHFEMAVVRTLEMKVCVNFAEHMSHKITCSRLEMLSSVDHTHTIQSKIFSPS